MKKVYFIPLIFICIFVFVFSNTDILNLILWELLLIFGYIAAFIDFKYKIVPNKLILAMLCTWVIVLIPQFLLKTNETIDIFISSLIGFIVSSAIFLTVYFISRKGLGGGDVKFMAVSGLYLGANMLLTAVLIGAILSAITCMVLIIAKRINKNDAIALIPFLYIGFIIVIFLR